MKRLSNLLSFSGLLLLCLLSSCSTKTLISSRESTTSGLCYRQAASAKAGYERLLLTSRVDNNSPEGARLSEVATRVIGAFGRYCQQYGKSEQFNQYNWEINLIRNDAPCVLALPGGKIAGFTGLFRAVDSDDELAYLIGRNVGHILACHQPRRSRFSPKSPSLTQSQFARAENVEWIGTPLARFRAADEKEADYIGLFLMIAAGYNPEEALKFKTLSPEHRQQMEAMLSGISPSASAFQSEKAFSAGLVQSLKQTAGDTLSIQEKWKKTLGAVPVPNQGEHLLIMLKSVSSFAAQLEQFSSLKDLGNFYLEESSVDGKSYQRVLLGGFANVEVAKKVLLDVHKQGFKEAFLIDYKDGKRGKRRY